MAVMTLFESSVVRTATVGPGGPLERANSIPETEAKDRIVANGMAMPAVMTKDGNGVWRGTSMRDGKPFSVAIDYKRIFFIQ